MDWQHGVALEHSTVTARLVTLAPRQKMTPPPFSCIQHALQIPAPAASSCVASDSLIVPGVAVARTLPEQAQFTITGDES